ncbi:ABC transporter substrate-binding protein [Trujillonella endophytica]|uniref:Iron complex transport system substrate-binding protein n=1 Tax=Trujillonella endophytica TaxID=673521 RepID=A0A1H8SBW1_9ACTN|nr:ABC transporter substrate-binding protein [Trujillella endophytica]SEO76065.1 iron complex transport system substrate-binding protein [Trujillella endophytica]
MPRSPFPSPRRSLALLLPAALLVLTACGEDSSADDDGGSASGGDGSFPVTVSSDAGEITLDDRPEAIVSLSATATEMLFAIGADDQVVAVDDTSNFPSGVPTTDLSAYTPNAEAIVGFAPDLVVLSDDINGIVDALETLDVPVLMLPAVDDLEGSYDQLRLLGEATGNGDGADDVVADIQERIDAAVASVDGAGEGRRVYHELDPSFYSADSTTFIGSVYALFGLENVADGASGDNDGYPQLSAEYVVGQAPELIVLADTVCCGESAATVAQRPAFDTVPAVQQGRILEASDDVASRWGPRIAEFTESVAAALDG